MATQTVSRVAKEKAAQLVQEGIDYYLHWDIERAVETLAKAVSLYDQDADYFLYLAQAHVRLGDYEGMRRALGQFLHLESDPALTDRFEILFGNAMDPIETHLTQIMTRHDVPLEVIGSAIQMWLDFRVALGRRPLVYDGSETKAWAAALDYTVRKVNFHEVPAEQLAQWYEVPPQLVRGKYSILIETLDVMPCDYRYFRGVENPLDKLVEAANMLEQLEERFYKP